MTAPAFETSDWEVPTHETALYHEMRHAHALVIPVINEGARIRGQLLRILAASLPVDVIVADGGSDDGSLEADFVATAGVRAVLTKTGPGKLSAQLRMAYAWCLTQGYEGIVTIDGNGKDGVEAIADMVAKLEEGCDYVQGSRYLPGGAAENTPLERTIANRMIHAPLLSLAGRHWFTDTTNGFRAYSARYLLHPGVRPFRREFHVYGLLFYLTVRAGQLGLKVAQVPVRRSYPEDGKVPTKIGGFASKIALLGETVHAATGGYTPDDALPDPRSTWRAMVVAALIALPLLLAVMVTPPYSPDSWAFHELSRTVLSDFYRFTHFRSYAESAPYSSAFPPLTPVLIALVDGLLGTGVRTGLYLAFGAFIIFAALSEAIGRRVTGAPWVGVAAALMLLLGPKMLVVELNAGRTIPLQLCLYALVLWGLTARDRIGAAGALGIGFAAGLAVLNRFDAILLPPLTALALIWLTGKTIRAGQALVGSLAAISPWLIYSWTTFGVIFATDNSGIATALDPRAFVTDWWPAPQPALADDPAAWAAKVMGNAGTLVWNFFALLIGPMGAALALALAVPAGLHWLAARRPHDPHGTTVQPRARMILAIFAAICALMMGPQVLTGYLEYRYYSALFWALFLLALCWIVARGASGHQRAAFAQIILAVALAATLPFSAYSFAKAAASGEFDVAGWSTFDAPKDVAQLRACLADQPDARTLVIGDDTFAARAGAQGGLATMMEPRNMAQGRLDAAGTRAFVEQWQVSHVLMLDPDRAASQRLILPLSPVPSCPLPLWRIAR